MPVDLVLKDSRILIHGDVIQAGLAINDGRIVRIARDINLPQASKEMNLHGFLILPGLIDAHVHLRDQQFNCKEDFFTGTAAAACGGVTLALDMPNNKPVTMDKDSLRDRMRIAAQKAVVNVAFFSAFPAKTEDITNIVREGVVGFKLYLSEKIGGIDPDDDDALTDAFRQAAILDVPVAVHAEDGVLLKKALKKAMCDKDDNINAYPKVHSPEVEVKAINRVKKIGKKTDTQVHICHVSTGSGIESISSAKSAGLKITCEVTPHHLLLSSHCMKTLGALALTNPPLRSMIDIQHLWSALHSGLIDILVSDHAPHTRKEKEKPSVWENSAGITGLETLLPLMLTQVNEGRLSLSKMVQMTSEKPAEIYKIQDRGDSKEGYYADLVVVDLKKEWKIDASRFYSKAKFSPFNGWHVKGKPVKTFVNGRLIMDEGEIVGKPRDGCIIQLRKDTD